MSLSRRGFLQVAAASGAGLGLAACGQVAPPGPSAPAGTPAAPPPTPAPIYVTRVVEATRIVAPTPAATRTQRPEEKNTMIWYVDIELPATAADPANKANFDQVRAQRTRVLADIADMPAEAIMYPDVTPELMREKNVVALALSGSTSDWVNYDFNSFATLTQIVTSGRVPVLGLCGGHQLLAYMYGGQCGPLRLLRPGEPDPADWAPGWFKEVGYQSVSVTKDDPIFAGLGSAPVFFESHYWQVSQMPTDFEVLASTPECPVQVMRHTSQCVYGTQFHPEVNSADHRDGRQLISNFFRIAGLLAS
ncbi:MAG: gamma-glutamyl-gamma-aminobutyrate hydrolase family protein [Anaerolineales bacterium]|nr:gamma-glutamyl-gamma-aminobutyrate hydrolase family protein [Anaerolineales bacterium]